MALWQIPVHWTVGGVAKIEAPTLEIALNLINEAPFPDGYDWSEDEFIPDDDIEHIRDWYNANQADEGITSDNRIISVGETVRVIDTDEICTVKRRFYRNDEWYYHVESCDGKTYRYRRSQIRCEI